MSLRPLSGCSFSYFGMKTSRSMRMRLLSPALPYNEPLKSMWTRTVNLLPQKIGGIAGIRTAHERVRNR